MKYERLREVLQTLTSHLEELGGGVQDPSGLCCPLQPVVPSVSALVGSRGGALLPSALQTAEQELYALKSAPAVATTVAVTMAEAQVLVGLHKCPASAVEWQWVPLYVHGGIH